jgi:hypothetical protein
VAAITPEPWSEQAVSALAAVQTTLGMSPGTSPLLSGRATQDAIVSVYGNATGGATPSLTYGASRRGAGSTGSGSRTCPGAG